MAANTNTPFGLRPVRSGSADAFAFQVGRYYIASADANAYYVGSPVKLTNTGDANGVQGITAAAGTDTLVGAIVGVEAANVDAASMVGSALNLEQVSIPATKTRDYYVYVADDPNQEFWCQADATTTNQVATKSNNNCSLTIAAPSPSTNPVSATVISSSTIATTNTLNIALKGAAPIVGQVYGAYTVYRCKINLHQYANGRTGV